MQWMTPTPELQAEYQSWLEMRPENVRAVASRFSPWTLYRMKSSGHRVTVYSFGETEGGEVTLTVNVLAKFNAVTFERQVFGIDPADLEECDLPAPDEPIGAILSREQAMDNIDEIRLAVRPDLWTRAPDGSAVLKGSN